MHKTVEITLHIPFHDLDPMGVVWHGNYVKYLELARCKLLEQIDYNYDQMAASGYMWPVVDLKLRYVGPLFFNQHIKIIATLVEWEYRLKIDYLIMDMGTGQRLTRASTVQVAVEKATNTMCFQSPPIVFEKLGVSS